MDIGLYSGAAAMSAGEKRLESITANLANASTVAYKRRASFTLGVPAGPDSRVLHLQTHQTIDQSNGPLQQTGNDLDLALEGDGYFVVEDENGRAFTRDGRFHLDDRGALVDVAGRAVGFEGGQPLLDPVGDPVAVDSAGNITQGTRQVGRLKVVDFDDREQLREDSMGSFRASPSMPEKPSTAAVRQGSVERSNVDALEELVGLVIAQRSFETASAVVQRIDQTYRRLNQPR